MFAKTCRSFKHLHCARVLWLLMPVIIGIWLCPVQSIAQTNEVESQLRERISGFWQAMQDADYDKAIDFIHPDSRKTFSRISRNRVLGWSIQKLEFDEDQTTCTANIIVRRQVAALAGTEIDWPLNNQWVLSDGQWYFKISWQENENPFFAIFKEQQKASSKVSEIVKPASEPVLKQPPAQKGDPKELLKASQRITPDPTNPTSVQYGEKARFRFFFLNRGTEPISVIAADADCHCTSVKQDDSQIPPGQAGIIEMVLDTFGLPLGRLDKSVSIQFSDLDQPVTLKLQIDALPNFKISPTTMDFGNVKKGEAAECVVKLSNVSNKTVKIVSKLNSDPNLSFTIDKSAINPGTEATISAQYASDITGEFLDSLMLETDLPAESIINIPVKGVVKP